MKKLTELIQEEGVFFEVKKSCNSSFEKLHVSVVPIGTSMMIKMYKSKDCRIEDELLNVKNIPIKANAYVLGEVGDDFVDGSFPVSVQFYHKV